MAKPKREAIVSERICKNGRKAYVVSYCLAKKRTILSPWLDYGVYFQPNDAEIVRDMIENGELDLMILQENE